MPHPRLALVLLAGAISGCVELTSYLDIPGSIELVQQIPDAYSFAFTSDMTEIVVVNQGENVFRYDIATGARTAMYAPDTRWGDRCRFSDVTVSRDGDIIVATGEPTHSTSVVYGYVLDRQTGNVKSPLLRTSPASWQEVVSVSAVAIDSTGTVILGMKGDVLLRWKEVQGGAYAVSASAPADAYRRGSPARRLDLSHDGRRVMDDYGAFWDIDSLTLLGHLPLGIYGEARSALYPNGVRALQGDDRDVRLVDPMTNEVHGLLTNGNVNEYGNGDFIVRELDVSDDGLLFATADNLGVIRVYDARSGQMLAAADVGEGRGVHHLRFAPDNRTLAACTVGKKLLILRLQR